MIAEKKDFFGVAHTDALQIDVIHGIAHDSKIRIDGVHGQKDLVDGQALEHGFCVEAVGGAESFPDDTADKDQIVGGICIYLTGNVDIVGDDGQAGKGAQKLRYFQDRRSGIQDDPVLRKDVPYGLFCNPFFFHRH